jgi:hypothetical protein
MNFSDVIKTFNEASAFELYRMRAALDRVLQEPHWLKAIQSRLRVGQTVQFFDDQANTLKNGLILEMRAKQVIVMDRDAAVRWSLPYAAINVDGVDVQIREQKTRGLSRNEIAVGEVVGFLDRAQQQRSGRVIRMNDKSVTLLCDKVQWRVAYGLLHRVVDADAQKSGVIDLIS